MKQTTQYSQMYMLLNKNTIPSFDDLTLLPQQHHELIEVRLQECDMLSAWLESLDGDYSIMNDTAWQYPIDVIEPEEELLIDIVSYEFNYNVTYNLIVLIVLSIVIYSHLYI